MNKNSRRKVILICLVLGVLSLIISPIMKAHDWVIIWCNDAFPGGCNAGGCQAYEGWWAANCQIHCTHSLNIVCLVPPQ